MPPCFKISTCGIEMEITRPSLDANVTQRAILAVADARTELTADMLPPPRPQMVIGSYT